VRAFGSSRTGPCASGPERERSKSLALLIEHLSTQRTRLERRVDRVVSSEQRSSG